MSQGKEDLKQIHLALIAAQESGGGGLFKFLQAEVDTLSDFAGLRLHKMILKRWPSYAATGKLDLDKNARWLLGRLAAHLWKTKIRPTELIASFREGTGRLGHLPDGVLRTLRDLLNSSMSGWWEKDEWNDEAQARINFYYFPPLEEAREIFRAKHGDVVWPPTDEVAMVEVRRAEAEAAAPQSGGNLPFYPRNHAPCGCVAAAPASGGPDPRARMAHVTRRVGPVAPGQRDLRPLGYGGPTQGALGHVRPRQRPVRRPQAKASNKLPRPRTAPEAGSPMVATFWRWFGSSLCRHARARAWRRITCIMGKRDLRRLSHWSKLHSRPEKRSQGVLVVVFLQEDVGNRTYTNGENF